MTKSKTFIQKETAVQQLLRETGAPVTPEASDVCGGRVKIACQAVAWYTPTKTFFYVV